MRWIAWVGLRIWRTGPTTTGRCASRRTRTARGSRSGWWTDGAASELAPPRAGAAGDVSGSQVTGGTRLRTHGSRIAAAFFAASLVGAPAHAREPHVRVIRPLGRARARLRTRGSRSSIPTGRSRSPGRSFRGGDDSRLGRARGQRPACHPGRSPAPRPMPAPGRDVARGAGLSLPAHGPSSSRGSAPGFPFRGNSLLRQSDRPRAP